MTILFNSFNSYDYILILILNLNFKMPAIVEWAYSTFVIPHTPVFMKEYLSSLDKNLANFFILAGLIGIFSLGLCLL